MIVKQKIESICQVKGVTKLLIRLNVREIKSSVHLYAIESLGKLSNTYIEIISD
jgi:hypothetical protein